MSRSQLSANAQHVLKARYLKRDAEGRIVESPDQLFVRVARFVAEGERVVGHSEAVDPVFEQFHAALSNLEFLPNSPTLMNAGTANPQLSACFVLPVEDSIPGIFDSLKAMALIQQSSGGTGFSFSRLRPKGDPVATTGGQASGPVSFMRIFDCTTENIRLGGRRRGANMGVLRVDHPDIHEFVHAKEDDISFRNFNLSVGATDAFLRAVEGGSDFDLINPRTGKAVGRVNARALFEEIAQAAWKTGDPGMIFLDTINRNHPLRNLAAIEATNPCGEVPLLPHESCNLGSINLARITRQGSHGTEVDWEKLKHLVDLGVRFLDNVLEVARWPLPEIEQVAKANRKIGLGVMGFAELLILLGIPYASEEAVNFADELMRFIAAEALEASHLLAHERGVFPNWHQSSYAEEGIEVRNATQLSIAPTGTLSILADTSPSIEPLFALAYRREHVLGEEKLFEVNPLFLRYAKEHGIYSDALMDHLLKHGTLQGYAGVPEGVRHLFRTALEISPEDHLRIQAAFQFHVDNAVSKTINLPHSATPEEIYEVYLSAWHRGAKGITVYRYGSKGEQVLNLGVDETAVEREHFAGCDPHECKL